MHQISGPKSVHRCNSFSGKFFLLASIGVNCSKPFCCLLSSFFIVLQEDGMNKSFENLETLCRSMTEHALEGKTIFSFSIVFFTMCPETRVRLSV